MAEDDTSIPIARMAVIPYSGAREAHGMGLRPPNVAATLGLAVVWAFQAALVLAGLAGIAWLFTHRTFAAFSPMLGVVLLIAVAMFFRGVRRSRAVAALNYVEQAVRLNLPLPPMLLAAERGEDGRLRTKLRRLRERLEDGHSLAASMDRTLPGLPARAIGLLAAAERSGSVAPTLARLVRELRRRTHERPDPSRGILLRWYPLVLLLGLSASMSLFSIAVFPKYQQIFRDFGVKMPGITVFTARLWGTIGPPMALGMVAVALVVSGQMLAETFAPRWTWADRGAHAGIVQQALDFALWWVPLGRGVVRNRGLADVCRVLADAAAAGRPTDTALHDAARLRVNVVLRRQVTHWGTLIVNGTPLAEAAREAGMPDLLVGMLEPASARAGGARGGTDVGETFDFLARYYEGRFSRAAMLLEGSAVPAMVLFFAVFVGSAALGLFLPMIELSNRMSQLSGFN
jgi:type II secretory pathway component PulF